MPGQQRPHPRRHARNPARLNPRGALAASSGGATELRSAGGRAGRCVCARRRTAGADAPRATLALEDDGAIPNHERGVRVRESTALGDREQLRDRSPEGRSVGGGGQIGFRPALGGPPHTRSVGRQRNPGEISVGARTGEGSPCHRDRENRGGKRGRPGQGDSSRGESRSSASASASASGGRAGSGTGASSPESTFARKRAR